MTKKPNHHKVLAANHRELINAIDGFALDLLNEAESPAEGNPPLGLPTKLDVLAKLSNWVAVRNKIGVSTPENPNAAEGSDLDGIRRRLKADSIGRTPRPVADRPGAFVNTTYGLRPRDDERPGDGAGLAELRARLPRADDGGVGNDRDGGGGENDLAVSDGGGVHADVSGDPDGDDDGADSERDL